MGINRIALKQHAKDVIRASAPSALLVTLVYLAIVNGISFWLDDPFTEVQLLVAQGYTADVAVRYAFSQSGAMINVFLTIVIALFTWVLAYGYTQYAMHLNRGQRADFMDLFAHFQLAGKIIVLQLLEVIFATLWTFLFIIPGIVALYRYRMAVYLLLDHPELSPLECIRQSKALMAGHKFDLFVLDMSFLGWVFLFSIPTGILAFALPAGFLFSLIYTVAAILCNVWITPYMECSTVGFYDAIRGADEPQHEEGAPGTGDWNDRTDPWN